MLLSQKSGQSFRHFFAHKIRLIAIIKHKSFYEHALIGEALEAMANSAKNAVCKLSIRPEEFGTKVDVEVGFVLSGKISFNAKWKTETLCQ